MHSWVGIREFISLPKVLVQNKHYSPTQVRIRLFKASCSALYKQTQVQILDDAVCILHNANSKSKFDDRSRGWLEGSLFNSYNAEV